MVETFIKIETVYDVRSVSELHSQSSNENAIDIGLFSIKLLSKEMPKLVNSNSFRRAYTRGVISACLKSKCLRILAFFRGCILKFLTRKNRKFNEFLSKNRKHFPEISKMDIHSDENDFDYEIYEIFEAGNFESSAWYFGPISN